MAERDLKAEVEEMLGLPVGPSTNSAYAVTGEPYLTMHVAGRIAEGSDVPYVAPDADTACDTFLDKVREYAAEQDDGCALYWRQEPQIQQSPAGVDVRARLLVSSAPVLAEAAS